ncbi:apolipoprotein N-acyltransferase [Propioniferax innocua]|uniref:Apolipoprotein N-acyltransferase n=1 Tax=Propioniferax innocua TaxID=1753 RepID=A0A542ZPT1_9ACTN|nr:apolipoprotein N-acyltransferase [Propioniferax innocua]TQL62368.1 apolipoprotein N-acyltransferase [Propioniferax innocua]
MSESPRKGRRVGLGAWLFAAGLGGLAGLGFEPTAWWPCHLMGLAGLFVRLRAASTWRQAAGWGYAFGFGMNLVSLSWLSSLLPGAGPVIAVVLVAFMSTYFALVGVAARWVWRLPWPVVGLASVWVAGEWLYSRFPFGGFGWTRTAYTMVDSPLDGWLPLVSVAGVSGLAALVSALAAWAWGRRRELSEHRVAVIAAATTIVALGTGGLVLRGADLVPEHSEELTIGMVQGNVDGVGVGGMGRARSVTNNHYSETVTLMAKARAGEAAGPDFVLWPENSTDVDPIEDLQTRRLVQSAAEVADVPILVGAVTRGPGTDERQTTALWWMPDGRVTDSYHKRNLVPFGEYIPFRDRLLPLIPLLELVGAQSIPGTSPGVVDAELADGRRVAVGDVICFELAYDDTVREAVAGSQVLVVQSNNATYRGTPQIDQQFAITRVRAMEARREVVVATTNSVSGHIDHRGRVLDRTQEMQAASASYTVSLRDTTTPATRFGGVIEAVLTVLGALSCGLGALAAWRRDGAGTMGGP